MLKQWLTLGLMLTLLTTWAEARQYYRYANEDGQLVIAGTIPPQLVNNGYDIIDQNGLVLERVAARSDEVKDPSIALNAAQRRQDEALLRLYRSPLDVDLAMRLRLDQLRTELQQKRLRLERLRLRLDKMASDTQQSETSVEQKNQLESLQAEYRQEINQLQAQRAEIIEQFSRDRARMVVVYEKVRGRPWVEPE